MNFGMPKESDNFQELEPGTYMAICYRLLDLGTQRSEWKGEEKIKHQIYIGWEVPSELIRREDGEDMPHAIGAFVNYSLNEKATLRKYLDNWFGDHTKLAGDLSKILEKKCMLSVQKNEKGRVIVSSVSMLPKEMESLDQKLKTPISVCSLLHFNQENFDAVPKGFKKIMAKSPEFAKLVQDGKAKPYVAEAQDQSEPRKDPNDVPDDDIGF